MYQNNKIIKKRDVYVLAFKSNSKTNAKFFNLNNKKILMEEIY